MFAVRSELGPLTALRYEILHTTYSQGMIENAKDQLIRTKQLSDKVLLPSPKKLIQNNSQLEIPRRTSSHQLMISSKRLPP